MDGFSPRGDVAPKSADAAAASPWEMQDSGTTAGLRGIDAVNAQVAWASGSGGTVLRTVDGGAHWTQCAVPDAAKDGAALDFRGVQGWDAQTAIVMASGPGTKSRLYKTTDGCRTWKLIFRNPDSPNGFLDSFWLNGGRGMLLGDPVGGRFTVFRTRDGGKTWKRDRRKGLSLKGRSLAAFAASNSCIPIGNGRSMRSFATGGKDGAYFYSLFYDREDDGPGGILAHAVEKKTDWISSPVRVIAGAESAGVFSVAYRYPVTSGICEGCSVQENSRFIAVGGDYTKPNEGAGTAAWSADGGWTWTASAQPPHGYRSAVAWNDALKAWIAVGTNGSDISHNDGKTWAALDDGDWNAVSLPFVVGPKGRIAKLNAVGIEGGKK